MGAWNLSLILILRAYSTHIPKNKPVLMMALGHQISLAHLPYLPQAPPPPVTAACLDHPASPTSPPLIPAPRPQMDQLKISLIVTHILFLDLVSAIIFVSFNSLTQKKTHAMHTLGHCHKY